MTFPRFHLAFPVADLLSTRQFYIDVLGCRVGREITSWIDFDFFGHQITAHLSPEELKLATANPVAPDLTTVRHFNPILGGPAWHRLLGEFVGFPVRFPI